MKLSVRKATILLALIISARATSFMFSKLCLMTMTPFSLIALRFSGAALLIFVIFSKKICTGISRHNVLSGMLIESLFFLVLLCEHTGLKTIPASTTSFIENMAIIIVPFIECLLLRRFPAGRTLLSGLLALIGVGALTVIGNGFVLTSGEIFTFGAAFFYALAIIVTGRLSKKGDPFVIGFFQVMTTGLLAWISVAVSGEFTPPSFSSQIIMLLLLMVVCTCFGFTLQPVVQSRLPSETVSAFCALGPLVASLLSIIFLREAFTPLTLLGACLILLGLSIQSGLVPLPQLRHRKTENI